MATGLLNHLRALKLSTRLLITYVSLMVAALAVLIVWTGRTMGEQTIQQTEHELELQAQIIANGLRDPIEHPHPGESGDRSMPALLASYAQNTQGRVTLLDPNLQVLYSSDAAVPLARQQNYPELAAAQRGDEKYDVRWDDVRREERLFVAAAVPDERGRPIGLVQLSVSMTPVYAEIARMWFNLLAIGVAVLALTILASVLLARQIAAPVRQLTMTSEQIAQGQLDQRVAPGGPDEIRRLGVAFNRMVERVQDMLIQQREFVDNAAHEFRSPLTGLLLRIEMLQTHGEKDPSLSKRYLEQMQHEVGYLQRLVDHLLALASVENRAAAPWEELKPAVLLQELAETTAILAQQAQITVRLDTDPTACISANADQMRIVLRNLFDNAMKYTRPGGTVTLSCRRKGDQVVLCVADTGAGIPADALPHIFERFYRVDPARTRGGAGLGLSLVQSIVQAHGGRITVESQVGVGSTFSICLPAK